MEISSRIDVEFFEIGIGLFFGLAALLEDNCYFDWEIMLKRLSKIEDFVILFLFVFGLILPVVRTSSLLLLVLLPIRFLFSNGIFSIVKAILLNKYIVRWSEFILC